MTISDYIHSRGLVVAHVAYKAGISRQALEKYGKRYIPTCRSLEKIAGSMTALGADTTVLDLVSALYKEEE